MTREEAIKMLKSKVDGNTDTSYEWAETVRMAIKALEQEPCEDAISRRAVLDGLAIIAKAKAKSDAQKSLMGRIMFFTERLPSVTPQPKIGHWIKNKDGNIYCSFCGCGALYDKVYPGESVFGKAIRVKSTFCPTCGAKMKEVEE